MVRYLSIISALFLYLYGSPVVAQEKVSEDSCVRVESVQADFVQEKQLPILARPLLSKGRFLFQAPDSLRWEYFSPIHTVLLMHDGSIRKFIKHDERFVEEQGMGVDSMQIVLREITSWLDGKITDTPTFKADVRDNNLIILTPKEAVLAKIISRIELRLLNQNGIMESVTLYEGAESFTRMVFSASRLNETIPEDSFIKP